MKQIMKLVFIWELFFIGCLLSVIQLPKTEGKNDNATNSSQNSKRSLDFPTIFYPGPDNKFITVAPPPSLPPHLKIFSNNRTNLSLAPITTFKPPFKTFKDDENFISTSQKPATFRSKTVSPSARTLTSVEIQNVASIATQSSRKSTKHDGLQKQNAKISRIHQSSPTSQFKNNQPVETSGGLTTPNPFSNVFLRYSHPKVHHNNQKPQRPFLNLQSPKGLKPNFHEISSFESQRNHFFNVQKATSGLNHHQSQERVHKILSPEKPFLQPLQPWTPQKPVLSFPPLSPTVKPQTPTSPSPPQHSSSERPLRFSPPQGPFSPREPPLWKPKSLAVTQPPRPWHQAPFFPFPLHYFISMQSQPQLPDFQNSHIHKHHTGTASNAKTQFSNSKNSNKSPSKSGKPEKTLNRASSFNELNHLNKQLSPFEKHMSSHHTQKDAFHVNSATKMHNLARLSPNAFSCRFHRPGYYADIDAGCELFHVCHQNRQYTFMCPQGTLFSQQFLICDWAQRVKCSSSSNSQINQLL